MKPPSPVITAGSGSLFAVGQNAFDAVHVRGNIHTDALVLNGDDANRNRMVESAELLELFGGFERRDREADEVQKGSATIPVDAEMLQEGEGGQLGFDRCTGCVTQIGDGSPREVKSAPGLIHHDFHHVGVVVFICGGEWGRRGGHLVFFQCARNRIDDGRIDEWFVSLDVHERVAGMTFGDLGDSVGAARVVRASHFDIAKALGYFPDLGVVGGHDDFGERRGLLALLDDILDEWFAGDFVERLARKACRAVARWNDTDNLHQLGASLRGRPD